MKKNVKAKKQKGKAAKKPVGKLRLAARIVSVSLILAVIACCAVGDWYVHQPREWLEAHRAFYTAPLWYFGNRTAFITDAVGWTGHDAVYDFEDPVPTNEVFFAGAPVRVGDPAPDDIVVLDRGSFKIGWSPSLRHPVWAAYHVVKDARFDALKRPKFQKDRSVASSPAPDDYARSGYDRGHVVPNRAIVTRYGPDEQEKTFLMTNIAPQRPALNRGPWREMEQRIADLWTARYGEIWVIVGAVSPAAARTKLENTTIDVPEQYYMLIAAQNEEGVRALAVLLPQTAEVNDFPVHNIVTIKELEAATGLEFFPDMPKFLARPLKADRPTRLWPIRWHDIVKLILLRFT
jgi:endonuclease G